MVRIYYSLFVRFYKFYSYFGEKDLPHFFSMAFLSLLVYFNVTAIIALIEIKSYPEFQLRSSIPILILVYVLNYFIFLHRKKYQSIIKNTSASNSAFWNFFSIVLVIIYVIFSIGFWIYTGAQIRTLNLV